jgi:hypothetical protein
MKSCGFTCSDFRFVIINFRNCLHHVSCCPRSCLLNVIVSGIGLDPYSNAFNYALSTLRFTPPVDACGFYMCLLQCASYTKLSTERILSVERLFHLSRQNRRRTNDTDVNVTEPGASPMMEPGVSPVMAHCDVDRTLAFVYVLTESRGGGSRSMRKVCQRPTMNVTSCRSRPDR